MANTTDREASKVRLLAMADDFESRAAIAQDLVRPPPADEVNEVAEPAVEEPVKVKPARRIARESKETLVLDRRSH